MKLLWLILSIFPVGLLAQTFPVDAVTGKIYYAEEVLVKDAPQLDLYHRAKTWFAQTAKPESKIVSDDLSNGVLIGRNYLLVPVKNQPYRIWYTLKFEMEDDRYWYSLTDFQLQKHSSSQAASLSSTPLEKVVLPVKSDSSDAGFHAEVQQSILTLIQQIKKSMN